LAGTIDWKQMRSYLFVPGDSPKKLEKAMTSGADAVLIDLEDSISTERKAEARQITAAFLNEVIATVDRPRMFVRVNGHQTGLIDDDLDGVMASKPDGILLPKAESGACVTLLDAKLTAREAIHAIPDGATKIMVLATETAAAMFSAGSYKGASPRLMGLTWGAEDLSAEIGAEANRDKDGRFLDPYRLARSICLTAAAAAGVQAIDTVYVDFRNAEGFRRETEEGRRDGFTGRLAIHPAQVPIINDVFTPTPAAIDHARRIVAAFAAANGAGTVGIDGLMYDRPHLVRAQQVLARAKAAGVISS
jgi:citrate lyase subunit beta/citryl-CoA lyase